MKLYLIRHGETVANTKRVFQGHFDSPLTEEGKQQAKKVALRLKDKKFDFVYSSPLSRALDTAKEIMRFHNNVPFEVDERLIECSLGDMEGKTRKELGIPETGRPPKYLRDTCEGFDEILLRADKFLHEILLKHKDDVVVFVSHGILLRAFLGVILGKGPDEYPLMDKLLNTSVTELDIDEDKNHKIVLHNCVEHLK